MSQVVRSLEHVDAEKKEDATLRKEAKEALSNAPAQQFVSELMTKLRALDVPWWSPEKLRLRWPAQDRMRWLRTRADIRQGITNQLTGLAKNAARKKSPDFQASLIDSVIDEGDVTAAIFEESFDPTELVLYGPADAFYRAFMDSMPWDQDTATNQEFATWLLECALSDKCTIDLTVGGEKERPTRKPILQPLDVRMAIEARVWHTRMPLEVRVSIDEARLKKERANEAFNAVAELAIATPAIIAANVPLRDLMPVFLAAERAMGFGGNTSSPKPRAENAKAESKSEVAPPREAAPSSIASSARASVRPPPVEAPPVETRSMPSEAPEGSWSLPPQASRSVTPPPFPVASPSVTPPPLPVSNRASAPPPGKATPSTPPASMKPDSKNGESKGRKGDPKADPGLDKVARGAVQGMLDGIAEPITNNDDQLETTNPWLTNQASDDGFDEADALLPPADSDTSRNKKKHGKS